MLPEPENGSRTSPSGGENDSMRGVRIPTAFSVGCDQFPEYSHGCTSLIGCAGSGGRPLCQQVGLFVPGLEETRARCVLFPPDNVAYGPESAGGPRGEELVDTVPAVEADAEAGFGGSFGGVGKLGDLLGRRLGVEFTATAKVSCRQHARLLVTSMSYWSVSWRRFGPRRKIESIRSIV